MAGANQGAVLSLVVLELPLQVNDVRIIVLKLLLQTFRVSTKLLCAHRFDQHVRFVRPRSAAESVFCCIRPQIWITPLVALREFSQGTKEKQR